MNSRPPRHSDPPPFPIPLDTRSAVAMLAAELHAIRVLLATLVSVQGQGQDGVRAETSGARRVGAWRERQRSKGCVFIHGRATPRTSEGVTGVTGGVTGGVTVLSDSPPSLNPSVFQVESLETHTPGGGQGVTLGVTPPPPEKSVCVFSYFQVLEILRGASPPLVLVAERKVELAFQRVVEELLARGVGRADFEVFTRWVREGGKDSQGGYEWKTQGPPDLWYLSSPGTLAKGLGMAKQWAAKLARAKAKAAKTSASARTSVPPPARPSVPPPPLSWARKA